MKDLASTIPDAARLTRGHMSMRELSAEALLQGADRVVIVGEKRGNPGIIRVYKPADEGLVNIVSFIVKGVALSRELGRGLPSSRGRLIVETDGSDLVDEFADAFIIAFHARVMEEPRAGDVVARIEAIGEGVVRVEFSWSGRLVGPRIKLGAPRRMIKERQ